MYNFIRIHKIGIRIQKFWIRILRLRMLHKIQILLEFSIYFGLKLLYRESGEEKTKCDWIAPSHPLSWPCVSDLLLLKGKSWLRAETLDDSTPQWRISELRVWSYEPFIVFAPSSSGYLSGQNLEVLYIIRNIIWNIIK